MCPVLTEQQNQTSVFWKATVYKTALWVLQQSTKRDTISLHPAV